jgi:predicted SprT family Zn-dependent metalloprotease
VTEPVRKVAGAGEKLVREKVPEAGAERESPATGRKTGAVGQDAELGAWCAETLRGFGMAGLARRVRVCWNPRMRTTAGRARWPDGRIELNPRLREVGEREVWRTLKHELAHLIAYERAGRRRIAPHGAEWQRACAELGIGGEPACHKLPFEARRMKRRWAYRCPHCGEEFQRVRRFRHAVACWPCCRRYNGGNYDRRFHLIERRLVD